MRDSSGNNRHGKIHGARWISLEESPPDGPLLARAKPILVEPAASLGPRATVSRPSPIDGLRSWSVEAVGLNDLYVNTVAWHPSGEWYVTYESSGTLRVWSADGQLRQVVLANLRGGDRERSAMFLDDGNLLATLSNRGDNTIRIWDTATWKCVREIPHPPGFDAIAMAWSPVLRRLAIAGHPGVFVINPVSGQTWQRGFEEHCHGADFAPDGSVLVVTTERGGGLIWLDPLSMETLQTVELRRESDGEKTYGHRVAFSPDSRLVACTSRDGVVRIFDAKTSELQTVLKPAAKHTLDLQWFNDSQRLAVASEGGPLVSVWDIAQPEKPLLKTGGGNSFALAISPDESEIIYHSGSNYQLFALNLESGLSRRVHGNDGKMAGGFPSSLSDQGDRVAAMHQGVLTIRNSATGRPLKRYGQLPRANRLEWAPDGQTIALHNKSSITNSLSLLDVDTGNVTEPLQQERKVWSTAWSPDGTRLAISGGDDPIEIMNPQNGKITLRFSEKSNQSFSLAWSPDGKSLAAWNKEGAAHVWDVVRGNVTAEEAEFNEPPVLWHDGNRLAWFPDSRRLCLVLTTHLTIWDSQYGEQSPLEHFSRGTATESANVAMDGASIMVTSIAHANFWRGETPEDRKFIGYFGRTSQWHPDSRRVLMDGTTAYDTHTYQRLGKLLRYFPDGGWAVIGPEGHYRGGVLGETDQQPGDGTTPEELAAIEKHLVYLTQHEDGSCHTYTPSEFRDTFDWKNDPNQATLLALPDDTQTPEP